MFIFSCIIYIPCSLSLFQFCCFSSSLRLSDPLSCSQSGDLSFWRPALVCCTGPVSFRSQGLHSSPYLALPRRVPTSYLWGNCSHEADVSCFSLLLQFVIHMGENHEHNKGSLGTSHWRHSKKLGDPRVCFWFIGFWVFLCGSNEQLFSSALLAWNQLVGSFRISRRAFSYKILHTEAGWV